MTTKHPWFKFYPQDWRGDAKLRRCSRAARSLWLDMLGLMHESERYGHLEMDGIALTSRDLARIFGDSWRSVDTLLEELLTAGVYSLTEAGTIYSRRMVRDADTRERRAAGGVRSLSNPNVPRPKDTTKDTMQGIHDGGPQIPDTRSQILERTTPARAQRASGAESPARPPRPAAVRASWLAPIAAVWEAKKGAFAWGKAGKLLKPLHDGGQSSDEIATRLAKYLDTTEAKYVSLARFAETYADHVPFRFKSPPMVDGLPSDELHTLLWGHPRSYVLA